MYNIVADTNILVSSIFWNGNPYQIIQKGIEQKILIFTSKEILKELRRILARDFDIAESEIDDILNGRNPLTREGVVVRNLDESEEELKRAKVKQTHDIYITEIIPSKINKGMTGAFGYSREEGGKTVGSGVVAKVIA